MGFYSQSESNKTLIIERRLRSITTYSHSRLGDTELGLKEAFQGREFSRHPARPSLLELGAETIARTIKIKEAKQLILWINGAFGSGKTTISYELNRRIPNSFVYDPENIGFFIRKNIPKQILKVLCGERLTFQFCKQ